MCHSLLVHLRIESDDWRIVSCIGYFSQHVSLLSEHHPDSCHALCLLHCPTFISRSAGITCDSTGMIMLAREGRLEYTARRDGEVFIDCASSTIVANSKN